MIFLGEYDLCTEYIAGRMSQTADWRIGSNFPSIADRRPLGGEIRSVYDAGVAAGTDKATILNQMSSKIGEQMTNGHFVSKHLQDQAVDFRDKGLTPQQRSILGGIIRSNAGIALPEGIPQHTHASFPSPRR